VAFRPLQQRPGAKPPADRVFPARDGDVALFWAAEEPSRRGLQELVTEQRALDFLKTMRDQPSTAAKLRQFYKAHWSRALEATSADGRKRLFDIVYGAPAPGAAETAELLGFAAKHLASGRLRAERVVAPRGGASAKTAEPERVAPVMASSTRTKLTWISIQLLDDDDQPVAGEAYELTLPDGAVRSGTLDGDGRATERGIDAGTCTVKFPGLDADSWEFLRSESE
jgi:hypothetical protein